MKKSILAAIISILLLSGCAVEDRSHCGEKGRVVSKRIKKNATGIHYMITVAPDETRTREVEVNRSTYKHFGPGQSYTVACSKQREQMKKL